MKAIVKSIGTGIHHNLRTWTPDNLDSFMVTIRIEVGATALRGSDIFTIKVATPQGLTFPESTLEPFHFKNILFVTHYDYNTIEKWVFNIVENCSGSDWKELTEQLKEHLNWEYDNYNQS